ncbi:hypothetical protein AKJ09_00077 [Labilithrix luteola]|uniref:Uncharacterized protein n=1 Tax=Labilithrix luteola TaxID=1391654 RepID=A0A0K1PIJ8_9BACT|nr:hypothetical protein [Labilithrix luteola]AKU93345.1 hypothetical protein AKJ09_00009 [Labilithrix luteola]AKU93413.1 hypothetical protein AKJ09_00077 [Labilithrix luteola]
MAWLNLKEDIESHFSILVGCGETRDFINGGWAIRADKKDPAFLEARRRDYRTTKHAHSEKQRQYRSTDAFKEKRRAYRETDNYKALMATEHQRAAHRERVRRWREKKRAAAQNGETT